VGRAGILVAGIAAAVGLGQSAGDVGVIAVLYGGPWLVGQALRAREARVAVLAVHAARVDRERERREREAVEAERARIARELHDIVAHSISVVAIQAQAVRRRLAPGQERESADLAGIETTARQAMAEMRRLLGVLRADGERVPLAPQPGLGQLDRLVEQTRATGIAVDLEVSGEERPLAPGIDLVAYRVVQEALTNVLKHAHATTAAVQVRFGRAELELTVEDDGVGAASSANGGHGLVGMRERVGLYGGSLDVGSPAGGGFRVRALLPLSEASQR
jgi:signal transduction histidine kinase